MTDVAVSGNSFPIIVPDWQGVPGHVKALATTRRGGCSVGVYGDGAGGPGLNLGDHVGDVPGAVDANRLLLRSIVPHNVAWLSQVHGTIVVDAAKRTSKTEADASIVTEKNIVCVVLTADCLPVLFADRGGRVVGAAHAGWRGLAGGVLQNTVAAMRAAGAGDIVAWLGPAIGATSFEVGDDVVQAFAPLAHSAACFSAIPGSNGKFHADIYGLARLNLAQAGLADAEIFGGGHCTVTEADAFYSYRRDGITGRMASLIWLE